MSKGTTLRNLQSRRIWEKRLAHYLAVFERALALLGQEERLPINEPELSRQLDFKLRIVCRELDPQGRFGRPVREAENLADSKFDTIQTHERKKPDFQWQYDDLEEPDPQSAMRSFAVECKRLGKGQNFNKKYVTRGVIRFRHPGWRYGKDLSEGLMIGYIQSGEHNGIRAKINETLRSEDIDELTCNDSEWKKAGISRLEHRFTREFPVSPFRLAHFWLDLRRAAKGNP
uniref:Uncharacterized protein n=1 Tax=Candidatus Kentrum sp. LPFa TaxID=2126335 RepID=A0A450WIL7_9GAMM|nr:MAG: hypothetical protein BECKLPF1236B_GA0070989_11047 [Candidatus Kentron sp. LPFa]